MNLAKEIESIFCRNRVKGKMNKKVCRELEKKSLIGENVFTVSSFLTVEECRQVIKAAEANSFSRTEQRQTRYAAHRSQSRISFTSDCLAALIWPRVKCFIPTGICPGVPVGLNDNFRIYKYDKGDSFGAHIDESVETSLGNTEYTLLVYLNGGESDGSSVIGGETIFYKKHKVACTVKPTIGTALLHRHGASCMLHAGGEVKNGTKYLLRTDVVFQN